MSTRKEEAIKVIASVLGDLTDYEKGRLVGLAEGLAMVKQDTAGAQTQARN